MYSSRWCRGQGDTETMRSSRAAGRVWHGSGRLANWTSSGRRSVLCFACSYRSRAIVDKGNVRHVFDDPTVTERSPRFSSCQPGCCEAQLSPTSKRAWLTMPGVPKRRSKRESKGSSTKPSRMSSASEGGIFPEPGFRRNHSQSRIMNGCQRASLDNLRQRDQVDTRPPVVQRCIVWGWYVSHTGRLCVHLEAESGKQGFQSQRASFKLLSSCTTGRPDLHNAQY